MFPHLTAVLALSLWLAGPVSGQDAASVPDQSPPRQAGFMTSYTFHLNAASFVTEDARFTWDSDLGGDIDLVDYGRGRLNFLANYKAVLGEEFRTFDLNQGSYTLDFRASIRSPDNEVAAVFHHVSRHLSDRPRAFPIDWNMAGVEYWQWKNMGPTRVESSARLLVSVERSYVDYQYEAGGQVRVERPVRPRIAALASAAITYVNVDREVFNRGAQTGARLEGGVQLQGDAGVVELFLAFERRIDAHPVEHQTRNWALLGFRLLNR